MGTATVALVNAGSNRLRYLVTATGADTAILTCSGAASPDIQTDSGSGQLHKISQCFDNGYGKLAAGALTQAKARALLASNDPTNLVGTGVPRALITMTPMSAITCSVDCNVDGNGEPTVTLTMSAAGTAYLDIYVPGMIGA